MCIVFHKKIYILHRFIPNKQTNKQMFLKSIKFTSFLTIYKQNKRFGKEFDENVPSKI